MATVGITLSVRFRSAYFALIDCAHEIATTHGEDAALKWAERTLSENFDLFIKLESEAARPKLRLIEGGR